MNSNQNSSDRNQRRNTNILLGAIACLLAGNLLAQVGVTTTSTALAQPGSGEEGLVSAAEQRKVMIAELRGLSSRVERVESLLAKGINVKVTDMPAVKLADPSQGHEPRDPKRASK